MAKSRVCPICKKDDQIKKIAAIRTEGVSTGVFAGPTSGITVSGGKLGTATGMTAMAGRTMTELASLLPPPEPPRELRPSPLFGTLTIVVASVVLFIGLCALIGSPNRGGFIAAGAILFFVGVAIAYYENASKKDELARRNFTAQAEWKRKMDIYNRLYYCARDHITFDPVTGEHRALTETWQLLEE